MPTFMASWLMSCKLVNELRDDSTRRPLILVHNTGGTKKVSRTRAVLTHNAGPVPACMARRQWDA